MADIVERLRCLVVSFVDRDIREAADEIKRLRERLEWREDGYDGIYCRDETIRQLDAKVAGLQVEISLLENAYRAELPVPDGHMRQKMADEIRKLKSDNARLRESLRKHVILGRAQYFYCDECDQRWSGRDELHAPGCLAARKA